MLLPGPLRLKTLEITGMHVLDCVMSARCLLHAGTYDDPNCMWKSYDLDHAVALVGYGTDEAGKDYWIIKNSWSSHWCDAAPWML